MCNMLREECVCGSKETVVLSVQAPADPSKERLVTIDVTTVDQVISTMMLLV
jgi:hypothetical protein